MSAAREAVEAAANLRVARLEEVRAACFAAGENVFELVLQDVVDVAYTNAWDEAARRLEMLSRKLFLAKLSPSNMEAIATAVGAYRAAVGEWILAVSIYNSERESAKWRG